MSDALNRIRHALNSTSEAHKTTSDASNRTTNTLGRWRRSPDKVWIVHRWSGMVDVQVLENEGYAFVGVLALSTLSKSPWR